MKIKFRRIDASDSSTCQSLQPIRGVKLRQTALSHTDERFDWVKPYCVQFGNFNLDVAFFFNYWISVGQVVIIEAAAHF